MLELLHRDYSLAFPPLSIAGYSFMNWGVVQRSNPNLSQIIHTLRNSIKTFLIFAGQFTITYLYMCFFANLQ